MTNSEFSDAFSTMLNSYNTQAVFGDQASRQEIVLDEYEKSVFLTQAQDLIVKSYFDPKTDQVAEGFDGSERRQVDFSSLITVRSFKPLLLDKKTVKVYQNGIYLGSVRFENTISDSNKVRLIVKIVRELNEDDYLLEKNYTENLTTVTLTVGINPLQKGQLTDLKSLIDRLNAYGDSMEDTDGEWTLNYIGNIDLISNTGLPINFTATQEILFDTGWASSASYGTFDEKGILFNLPGTEVNDTIPPLLFMLNEKLIVNEGSKVSKYVVVPINYKEYDRQSSKPYSEPLKKQCWRLFLNEGDTMAELIPIWDKVPLDATITYKIRYVRRPKPIILVNLPDGLEIDGKSDESPCELNKILHMDILNQAFQLALATKGGGGQLRRRRKDNEEEEE